MGLRWSGERPTPIVSETAARQCLTSGAKLLEIGCGEGRDACAMLEAGYDLLATDAAPEAIAFCRRNMPAYAEHFALLDCLREKLSETYDFIYAVALLHMLVPDEDRTAFYRFIGDHLKPEGTALICTMGDGVREMQSDISEAFTRKERDHPAGKLLVAATSCRVVSFPSFLREIRENNLRIIERGITEAMPDFDKMLYALVQRT